MDKNQHTDTDPQPDRQDETNDPEPYSTHEGEIANELRSIYNTLSGGGSSAVKISEAKPKIKELTQELEETAWGETRPMDHVEVVDSD